MEKMTINDYFKTLTTAGKRMFAIDVALTCDMSVNSFYRKRTQDKFSKLEETAIRNLIKSKDYEKS